MTQDLLQGQSSLGSLNQEVWQVRIASTLAAWAIIMLTWCTEAFPGWAEWKLEITMMKPNLRSTLWAKVMPHNPASLQDFVDCSISVQNLRILFQSNKSCKIRSSTHSPQFSCPIKVTRLSKDACSCFVVAIKVMDNRRRLISIRIRLRSALVSSFSTRTILILKKLQILTLRYRTSLSSTVQTWL